MIKKIRFLLIISLLFFSPFIFVSAKENTNIIDFNKKGNLEITLNDNENEGVSDALISLYYVASANVKDNNLSYIFTKDFKDCNISLDKLENKENEIYNCVTSKIKSNDKYTNQTGKVTYNNLDLGLYLVVQKNKKEGYSNIDPFLVIIPESIEDRWNYNIEALPKTEIYKEIDLKVIKEWNTTRNHNLPSEVTINLYKDNILLDTIELNATNDWQYIWNDIEKSDTYRVEEINIPIGYTVSYKNEGYVFTVINTDTLAQTGQIYYPIIMLSLIGGLCIFIGLYINKKDVNE